MYITYIYIYIHYIYIYTLYIYIPDLSHICLAPASPGKGKGKAPPPPKAKAAPKAALAKTAKRPFARWVMGNFRTSYPR